MAQFNNLKSLYDHLERQATNYAGGHRISSLFGAVYKLKEAEDNRNEADQTLWECWFFGLKFTPGDVENWCSHITERFNQPIYTHVAERLMSTRNSVLRARYAHILWGRAKQREIGHARIAIDSYLEAGKAYEIRDKKEPQGLWGLEVLFAIRNAYGLAIRTQYRITEVKTELFRLIRRFNPKSRWSFRVRQELITVMLEDKQQFEISELAGLQEVCWRLADVGMKSRIEAPIQEAKDMLGLGEKIDQRLRQKSHNWSLRRGKCYEILMQIREEGDLATNVPSVLSF